jgi:hypothetical protein
MYFDLQVPAPVEMSRDELIVLVCEQADRIAAQDARLAAADGQITAMARRRGRLIRSTDAVVDGSAWAAAGTRPTCREVPARGRGPGPVDSGHACPQGVDSDPVCALLRPPCGSRCAPRHWLNWEAGRTRHVPGVLGHSTAGPSDALDTVKTERDARRPSRVEPTDGPASFATAAIADHMR